MILSELIERVKLAASMMSKGEIMPISLNSKELIETILPKCFAILTDNVTKDKDGINSLRQDHTIAFTGGVGTLPETIKERFANSIYFKTEPLASYTRRYEDFYLTGQSELNTLTGEFTVHNRQIFYRASDNAFGSFTGSLVINAVTLPVLPTLESEEVDLKDNLIEEVILLAAGIINGSMPVAS